MDPADILVELQKIETLEAFELNDCVIEAIENSGEDIDIRICERLACLIMQDSSFGISKVLEEPLRKALELINNRCLEIVRGKKCVGIGNEWFGGRTKNGSGKDRTLERAICGAVISDCLLGASSSYRSIEHNFGTSSEIAQALLNNDERCLMTLCALLKMIDRIDPIVKFDPCCLFLHVMVHIKFDYEVILDWLSSELVATSLFFRVLKSQSQENYRQRWLEAAQRVDRYYSKRPKLPSEPKTNYEWKECPEARRSSPKVVLRITQLEGDVQVTKEFTFFGEMPRKCVVETDSEGDLHAEEVWVQWRVTVATLHNRLERLLRAKLVGAHLEPICRAAVNFLIVQGS
ncbi:unnamed protein product [Caenorhabditis auriculariae]|uniref:Uncharacterized protein n=1 Tax=Caenorhabditis auriculariae TaxID=2777116 RepID=A0A8S1HBQ2_9PELO|nr:unnamed protein product [Caenorhabditis auriculariae]